MLESTSSNPFVIETTPETFEADVFERSRQVPVAVDFWAPWCQPCRMLGPILEDQAREQEGRFILVKANTEQVQRAAMEFNVSGIPAVFGVCDGQVVDYFQGALPPEHVRRWIERLVARGELLEVGRLEASDPRAAVSRYRDMLERHPSDAATKIGLARALLASGNEDECRVMLEELEQRGFLEPEAERVRAELELRGMMGGDLGERRAAVAANPSDLGARLKLAQSLAGNRLYAEALAECLAIVQQDRRGLGEEARQMMVDIFRILPGDSELVSEFRRKLSMALY